MENQSEYEYARLLYLKGFLPGPDTCNGGCKYFDKLFQTIKLMAAALDT